MSFPGTLGITRFDSFLNFPSSPMFSNLSYVPVNLLIILRDFSGFSQKQCRFLTIQGVNIFLVSDLSSNLWVTINILQTDIIVSKKLYSDIQMNREKLIKMAGAVRTGGKGSVRRYNK